MLSYTNVLLPSLLARYEPRSLLEEGDSALPIS